MSDRLLVRIIYERFHCNRLYAAATSLTAGGLAAQSVNILFKYASFHRRLGPEACLTHSYKGASPLVESPRRWRTPFGTPRRGKTRLEASRARLAWRLGGLSRTTVNNVGLQPEIERLPARL
jgi:hypothetical protein